MGWMIFYSVMLVANIFFMSVMINNKNYAVAILNAFGAFVLIAELFRH